MCLFYKNKLAYLQLFPFFWGGRGVDSSVQWLRFAQQKGDRLPQSSLSLFCMRAMQVTINFQPSLNHRANASSCC
jgi:hypothetical protein